MMIRPAALTAEMVEFIRLAGENGKDTIQIRITINLQPIDWQEQCEPEAASRLQCMRAILADGCHALASGPPSCRSLPKKPYSSLRIRHGLSIRAYPPSRVILTCRNMEAIGIPISSPAHSSFCHCTHFCEWSETNHTTPDCQANLLGGISWPLYHH